MSWFESLFGGAICGCQHDAVDKDGELQAATSSPFVESKEFLEGPDKPPALTEGQESGCSALDSTPGSASTKEPLSTRSARSIGSEEPTESTEAVGKGPSDATMHHSTSSATSAAMSAMSSVNSGMILVETTRSAVPPPGATKEDEEQLPPLPKQAPLAEDQVVLEALLKRYAKAETVLDDLRGKVEVEILKGSTPKNADEERQLAFFSKSTMMRYLSMQEGNVDKALKAMKDTFEWRKKMFHKDLFLQDSPFPCCRACAKDPTSHCFLCVGKDVLGRDVVYSCAGRASNKTPEDGIEHMSAELERLFLNSKNPGSIVWIVDFAGFGFSDCNPRTGALAFPMFSSHYPERFGQIVCLDLPWAFRPLYAAAGKIFDAATMQKVVNLKGKDALKRYADAYWSNDPGMRSWLDEAINNCKGAPGSFPDMKFARELRRTPQTELAIRTLERCAEKSRK